MRWQEIIPAEPDDEPADLNEAHGHPEPPRIDWTAPPDTRKPRERRVPNGANV